MVLLIKKELHSKTLKHNPRLVNSHERGFAYKLFKKKNKNLSLTKHDIL